MFLVTVLIFQLMLEDNVARCVYINQASLSWKAGFQPKITHQAVEATSLTSLVAAGLGIAFIPEFVGRLAHEDVVHRPLKGKPICADVHALWVRENAQPLIANFLEIVRAEVSPSPPGSNHVEREPR